MADVTVLTDTGEAWVVDKLDAATRADFTGWGTGATGAAKGGTLDTPAAEARVQGTTTQPSADILQVVSKITCAGAGKTITNAGLFTDITAGILFLLGSFTGIPLSVGDSIEFTWTFEVT
jgi:hypothetical protein